MTLKGKVGLVLFIPGAIALGVDLLAPRRDQGPGSRPERNLPVGHHDAATVIAVERGFVEPSPSDVVRSAFKGRTTIVTILPEETRVKKGQLVCTLDASAVVEALRNQAIAETAAEGRLEVGMAGSPRGTSPCVTTRWGLIRSKRELGAKLRRQIESCRIGAGDHSHHLPK